MVAVTSTHERWSEDFAWQALRGLELGRALCACDGHYHALWGALRNAGLNNTMKGEAPILASLLAPYLQDDARVMIGGSADPGVLCGIGRIYSPRMPIFTIIDKCRSPLVLIGEFAGRNGIPCRTLNRDLLELDGSEQWDQIVLHYTPDFMDTGLRGALFRSLAGALAPEGILVCATMTGASIPLERRGEMEDAFFARALVALQDTPMADIARSPEFENQLRVYTAGRTKRRLMLPTTNDICELLEEAGFRVLQKHATSRARRLGGADVMDTSTIIVASAR